MGKIFYEKYKMLETCTIIFRLRRGTGSDGSAAGGGYSDLSEWPRPRCPTLPVADEVGHKRVPGSVADEADLSARKIPGTPNGRQMTQPYCRQGSCRAPQQGASKPRNDNENFKFPCHSEGAERPWESKRGADSSPAAQNDRG